MNRKTWIPVTLAAMLIIVAVSCNRKAEFGKSPVSKVIDAMTLEEKVNLLVSDGQTYAIPRLGIPSVTLKDLTKESGKGRYTSFPEGTVLAQSWNRQLIEETGAAIGDEAKRYGADLLLSTTDRSFEQYTEEPVIWGATTAALVRGIQSNGIGATVRYNDLEGLKIAVRESAPWAVMTNDAALTDSILREYCLFEGLLIGKDLFISGNASPVNAIIDSVKSGKPDETAIDLSVSRMLAMIELSPKMQGYEPFTGPDLESHARLARTIATEGLVLLKNNGALPLDKKCRMIALYGTKSYDSRNTAALSEVLKTAGYKLEPSVTTAYSTNAKSIDRKPYQYRADAISSDIAVITIGRGTDDDFFLSDSEQGLINDVCEAFHSKGKKVAVILNTGSPIETASWKDCPDAILLSGLSGQQTVYALTDVLKGVANPSGKLVETYVADYEKCLVSYPLGYGLSYTTFSYSEPQATLADGVVNLSVKVTNTGKTAGKEAVQVYIADELKTFGKTAILQPGESETMEFKLSGSDLAVFNPATSGWQLIPGEYVACFSASSQDIRCQAQFSIVEE